jgi:hypothetical protein
MGKRARNKQCYWCGSLDNDNNHVNISEDVPPRWLSGIKKVKEENCVPQCETCKKNLAVLDNAVNEYFRYGAGVDLDIVEQNNSFSNNKGIIARKINLNGKIDYAQANGCLLLWLRKLLVGLWYKEKDYRFDGGMFILAPWITYDNKEVYVSNIAIPPEISRSLLRDIDDYFGYDSEIEYINKIRFKYSFVNTSLIVVPKPLQLLRFSIFGSYCGYCLFIPKHKIISPAAFYSLSSKPPLYVEKWLKGIDYFSSSLVVDLTNSLKSISPEEAAKRVIL